MSRTASLIVSLFAAVCLMASATALRAEEAAAEAKEHAGVVKSVDAEHHSFVLTVKSGDASEDVTVKVDEKTEYVDAKGEKSTLADVVKAEAEVTVTETGGVASKVAAKKAE